MYLDYSKLEFDIYGRPDPPELMLKTLSDRALGTLSGVNGLKFNIKFSEPSEMTFSIPSVINSDEGGFKRNPLYDSVTGRKIIYTKRYGVYVTMNPAISSDGISETKTVKAYSLEKRLDDKRFFLEEGTYNFYHPITVKNTVLGRILDIAKGWRVGYVSPSLFGRYRTFEQYDDYLLSFVYNTAPQKFRCVFVFDPYEKTINVYDADEKRPTLPIYLDFSNLLKSVEIEEISDELVTALRPYGADGLDIRSVNPIGTNWIYNLSHFIANGDIPAHIAAKWQEWQQIVLNRQEYYKGLVAMRASGNAQLVAARASLADLNGDLESLTGQQSVAIQAIAIESTDEGKAKQQETLDSINAGIAAKKEDISKKEAEIAELNERINGESEVSYNSRIQAVVNELSVTSYFTEEEYNILQEYFIEQDITEDTFVASSIDTSITGSLQSLAGETISITESSVLKVDLGSEYKKHMYAISGGSLSISGGHELSCDIIRGTLEISNDSSDNSFVISLFAGTISVDGNTAPSGIVTITGIKSSFSDDVSQVDKDGIISNLGTSITLVISSGSMYQTANASEYQKYSTQSELYDYATSVLEELATPTYEFSVESGNLLFSQEFAPFRNSLELGSGVHLRLDNAQVITPAIIEIEFGFEKRNEFAIIFSNRFKRHDEVNTLKDMLESGYSSGRNFEASKHIYNQTAQQASAVSDFMNNSLDAAKNTILAAANQSVIINGAGIQVGGDSNYQLRIVDNMIAMTDDGWQTAKMALGRFSSPEIGEYWGINTEVLGGKITITQNLFVESVGDNGTVQFRVDASGAWLNNSTFVLQKDNGGKIIIDPKYGILAGTGELFSTDGTTVAPSFIDSDGAIIFDDNGIPKNTNFYLDISNGSAYFRGTVNALSGEIGGWKLSDDYIYSGTESSYVALNASDNTHSAYAIWAGADSPEDAPFWVKRNGDMSAKEGVFEGVIHGATYEDGDGNEMTNEDGQFTPNYLSLYGLTIKDESDNVTFEITPAGSVKINGNITMAAGTTINWAEITNENIEDNPAYSMADSALSTANNAENNLKALSNGEYAGGTFITGKSIYSPVFYASTEDDLSYGAFEGDSLIFYKDGLKKIALEYGTNEIYGQSYAIVKLGNLNEAYLMKRSVDGRDQLWVGSKDEACGVLFDFTNNTYSFRGTQV